jgi:hypothetical protein
MTELKAATGAPMHTTTHKTPAASDVTVQAGNLLVGLGILTFQVMPLALPGLLLLLPVVLPLLAIGLVVLPVWLVGKAVRALARRLPRGSEPARRAIPGLRPGTG